MTIINYETWMEGVSAEITEVTGDPFHTYTEAETEVPWKLLFLLTDNFADAALGALLINMVQALNAGEIDVATFAVGDVIAALDRRYGIA